MHNSHDTPTDTAIAEQEHTDEERVRELVQQTRELLAEDDSDSAIALFSELHPADQADVLAGLARERQDALLKALPSADTADILEHLDLEMAVQVSEGINAQGLADILDASSPDVAADILKHLPRAQSQATLQVMREAEAVAPLLRYPDDRAGGLMTPDYPAISGDMTATDALDLLRHLGPEAEDLISVFVVDGRGRLEGSLSLARLALAQPTTRVRDIMDTEVISVSADTDQEECARILEHYGLSSLPVLDQAGRFIGVIWSEDVLEVLEEEATEDMYRLAGMGAETVFGPFQSSVRSRLPWLSVNLATVFLSALVINLFEPTIAKVVALAAFLPVIAGQGGIGGTQTLTLVVRSMALGELSGRRGLHLLAREVLLGLVHGVFLGVVVGLVAYGWKGNYMLGAILGLAMVGNMLIAGFSGAGVPLLLRALRIDPAVASAVIVTTFTDVMGFFLFLGLATALINFLL